MNEIFLTLASYPILLFTLSSSKILLRSSQKVVSAITNPFYSESYHQSQPKTTLSVYIRECIQSLLQAEESVMVNLNDEEWPSVME